MLSADKNLSYFDSSSVPDAKGLRIGIVVSEWNNQITESLFIGALETLLKQGCLSKDIFRKDVPGSFELILAAKWMLETHKPDAVICIGCVIQGDTSHFDFICGAVSSGIMQLNLDSNIPVIFGVLTTNDMQQAIERAGGKHGNKGVEAAVTAIKMAVMKKNF